MDIFWALAGMGCAFAGFFGGLGLLIYLSDRGGR